MPFLSATEHIRHLPDGETSLLGQAHFLNQGFKAAGFRLKDADKISMQCPKSVRVIGDGRS